MTVRIIADDSRLGGRTPVSFPSCISLAVDEATPIDTFIYRCASVADIHGGISTLYIIAQSVEQAFAGESDGGDGIVFCREHLHLGNVERFSVLRGKIEHIVLIICAPLPTPFDVFVNKTSHPELLKEYQHDGDELCRQLARQTGAKVVTAREPRHSSAEAYSAFAGYEIQGDADLVDFTSWDGIVTRYDGEGIFGNQQMNLPNWTDPFGSPLDPRKEPAA